MSSSVLFAWRSAIVASDLPPTTRLVLLTLSLHMDAGGGSCWPSVELLARETGANRATVIRHLAAAERLGWLAAERSRGRTSNHYSAAMPKPEQSHSATDQPSHLATVAESDRRRELPQPSPSAIQPSLSVSQPSHRATRGRTEGAKEVASEDAAAFAAFWDDYPRRNGQRVGRAQAEKVWSRMTQQDRAAAHAALPAYTSSANGFPKDCERYLRNRLWADIDLEAAARSGAPFERRPMAEILSGTGGPLIDASAVAS
jgi:hypothetical protein